MFLKILHCRRYLVSALNIILNETFEIPAVQISIQELIEEKYILPLS